MGSRTAWVLAGALVAITAAVNAAGWYAESGHVGLRARSRIRHLVRKYPLYFVDGPSCDLIANETSAISTLRNLTSAQAQFQAAALVDEDRDGVGEYATFGELSGARRLRGSDHEGPRVLVNDVFRNVGAGGWVTRAGYVFRMWLPTRDSAFVGETQDGFAGGALDADAAEQHWRCYAWPSQYDHSGLRTFFVDESGDIWSTDDERYTRPGGGPARDAATPVPGSLVPEKPWIDSETPSPPATYTGRDGNAWRKTN